MSIRYARLFTFVLAASLCIAGCAGGDDAPSAPVWDYSTATEGNITTVTTTAGSQWGAQARLVEELSIGVEEGEDPYMFARIAAIWPGEEMVLVADGGLPAVRAFDLAGNYLFDVGRPGQGPGEYERPSAVALLPDGRILVAEPNKAQIYEADGTFVEQWTANAGGMMFRGPNMVTIASDGTMFRRVPILPEDGEGRRGFSFGNMKWGMRELGPDGEGDDMLEAPVFDYEPKTLSIVVGDNALAMPAPFVAQAQWTMLPDGGFAAGVPTEYRFEIRKPDHTIVAEKYFDPVPVADGEIELRMKSVRFVINGQSPKLEWGEIEKPEFKPAYDSIFPTRDGRVFLTRSGPVTVNPDCLAPDVDNDMIEQMDCSSGVNYVDLFDGDGMFVGTFELPEGVQMFAPYLDADTLWTGAQDDMGTVTVKKFRIVPPRDLSDT